MKLESRRTAQRLLCCLPLCIGVFAMHSALAISPQQIEATLTELVQQHHGSNRTQVELAPMPPYLQRAQCADLAVVPRTSSFAGNVPIALRCAHPKPWSAYLSARVTVWREVLTACRSLARNETLVSADLCLQEQPSNALRQHPLHSASEAVGMAPKRAINAGSVLYRTQLAPAVTVARGDQVSIEARRGQVLIQAVGKALDAGSNGDQVRVQNARSGRKITAWVVGPGRVTTSLSQNQEKTGESAKVLMGLVDSAAKNPAIAAE